MSALSYFECGMYYQVNGDAVFFVVRKLWLLPTIVELLLQLNGKWYDGEMFIIVVIL